MKLDSKSSKNKYILVRQNRIETTELLADETIFSLANGKLGTKGHFIEGYGTNDYPQTMLNGFYDTYPFCYEENYQQFPQEGQTIVLLPDASYIKIETVDGVIDLTNSQLLSLDRSLNMQEGTTTRKAVYQTKAGYEFVVSEKRVLSSKQNMIVSRLTIETSNYAGPLWLSSYLRMPLAKKNLGQDPRVSRERKHLSLENIECSGDNATLVARTLKTNFHVKVAITHDKEFEYHTKGQEIIAVDKTSIAPTKKYQVTKYQLYASSLFDGDIDKEITDMLDNINPFEQYVSLEKEERATFWSNSYLKITDKTLEEALLYNVYQLNQSAGDNQSASIASKGITGQGYEGHYFWDTECYMLPYFIFTQPDKAKKLLLYRYYTLDSARAEAKKLGVSSGAKIAWRTINGEESSPYYPAGSAQVHINSDVALAVINYYYATLDNEFMFNYGVEMLIETAVFLVEYGHFKDNEFHLDAVTGPDEYTTIVNDNYYTNSMAKMHFEFTYNYIDKHKKRLEMILDKLEISDEKLTQIELAARQMTLLIDKKSKVINQDASFMIKKDFDIKEIPENKFPLLLNYHPLFIYKHQILKQADAVLSLVLLGEKDQEVYEKTFEYYLKRTTHDSSLSKCIYGIAAYHLGKSELAYQYFQELSLLDLEDKKRHTQHGLHMANLGGSYLMLIYGLFGVRIGEYLSIDPPMQEQIKLAEVTIRYQSVKLNLKIEKNVLSLVSDLPIKLKVYGKIITVDKDYSILVS